MPVRVFVYSLQYDFLCTFSMLAYVNSLEYEFLCTISILTIGNCTQNPCMILRALQCQMTVDVSEFLVPEVRRSSGTVGLDFVYNTGAILKTQITFLNGKFHKSRPYHNGCAPKM